jgi:hypothetical protein
LLAGLISIVAINALFFFSSPVIKNDSLALNAFTNPFYQLISDGKADLNNTDHSIQKKKEVKTEVVNKETKEVKIEKKNTQTIIELRTSPKEQQFVLVTPDGENGFSQIDQRLQLEPVLKKSEEAQIKGVVAATKKVLEQTQWKQVEKNVADALTQLEKEKLKEKYFLELQKVNWQKLEERLKLSYDNINWDKVNVQLGSAITNITLDSIATVYNLALSDMNTAQQWMNDNKVTSIPDTDLQLKEVQVEMEKLQKQLDTIQAIRDKKIIHL